VRRLSTYPRARRYRGSVCISRRQGKLTWASQRSSPTHELTRSCFQVAEAVFQPSRQKLPFRFSAVI
jgi:hypothetical protein